MHFEGNLVPLSPYSWQLKLIKMARYAVRFPNARASHIPVFRPSFLRGEQPISQKPNDINAEKIGFVACSTGAFGEISIFGISRDKNHLM